MYVDKLIKNQCAANFEFGQNVSFDVQNIINYNQINNKVV